MSQPRLGRLVGWRLAVGFSPRVRVSAPSPPAFPRITLRSSASLRSTSPRVEGPTTYNLPVVTQLSEPPDRPSRASRRLSLIVPVLNEESNITTLYQALQPELERLGADWELIFVDDGSTDGSAAAVLKLHGGD